MSFFESISKKAKLKAAIKQTGEARSIGGHAADQLFKKVYQDYAEVVANEPLIAEALYNWGLALLHQARTKSGEAAAKLYQDAIAKFSFCLTIEPAYLGAALDGGFAYMELARVKAVGPNDRLYGQAKSYFDQANSIQAGSASYNVACIYGLRGEKEGCLNALEISKNKGYLPVSADILADPDLDRVKGQDWFIDFMESLNKEPEAVADEISEAVAEDTAEDEKDEVVKDEPVNEETGVEDAVIEETVVKESDDVTPFKAAADYTAVAAKDEPENKEVDTGETVEKN
ncbi:MAG: TPR end-of-group domain-containing protein [Methylobacter sp.]